jgi:hypothetical protein
MRKHKHRKLLAKTRHQRRKGKNKSTGTISPVLFLWFAGLTRFFAIAYSLSGYSGYSLRNFRNSESVDRINVLFSPSDSL